MNYKDEFLELVKDEDFDILSNMFKIKRISIWTIINKLQKDENSYSDFLYFFLNPDSGHGLGDAFLKEFLYLIIKNENDFVGNGNNRMHPMDIELFHFDNIKIYREYDLKGYGRIDLLIEDEENGYLILIENKLYSKEGKEQTNRYNKAQKKLFDINNYPDSKRILIFLSPDGLTAENENFISVSYQILIDCVINLLDKKQMSKNISTILEDYLYNLKGIIMDSDKIKLAEQIYAKYAETIDFIYKAGNDQIEVPDSDWNGNDFYYNIGENEHRNWDDYIKYSFISAGGGKKYSKPLKRLKVGNRIYAYFKGKGYLGVGIVKEEAVPAIEFISILEKENLSLEKLVEPGLGHNLDDPELCEWIVKVEWEKTVSNRDEAVFFKGIFANQNIICRLTNKHITTLSKIKEQLQIQD